MFVRKAELLCYFLVIIWSLHKWRTHFYWWNVKETIHFYCVIFLIFVFRTIFLTELTIWAILIERKNENWPKTNPYEYNLSLLLNLLQLNYGKPQIWQLCCENIKRHSESKSVTFKWQIQRQNSDIYDMINANACHNKGDVLRYLDERFFYSQIYKNAMNRRLFSLLSLLKGRVSNL